MQSNYTTAPNPGHIRFGCDENPLSVEAVWDVG